MVSTTTMGAWARSSSGTLQNTVICELGKQSSPATKAHSWSTTACKDFSLKMWKRLRHAKADIWNNKMPQMLSRIKYCNQRAGVFYHQVEKKIRSRMKVLEEGWVLWHHHFKHWLCQSSWREDKSQKGHYMFKTTCKAITFEALMQGPNFREQCKSFYWFQQLYIWTQIVQVG